MSIITKATEKTLGAVSHLPTGRQVVGAPKALVSKIPVRVVRVHNDTESIEQRTAQKALNAIHRITENDERKANRKAVRAEVRSQIRDFRTNRKGG